MCFSSLLTAQLAGQSTASSTGSIGLQEPVLVFVKEQVWRGVTMREAASGGPFKFRKTAKMVVLLMDLGVPIVAKTEDLRPMPRLPPRMARQVSFFAVSFSIT